MENKNTIVALVLMLAVWLGFTFLFPPQEQAPVPETSQQQVAGDTAPVAPAPAGVAPAVVPALQVAAEDLREVVVETELFKAVLTNSGGRIKHFELKNFKETAGKDAANIRLVETADERLATLQTSGTDGLFIDPAQLYTVSVEEKKIEISGDESRQITFTASSPSGVVVEKIYRFYGNRYDFEMQLRAANSSGNSARGNLEVSLVQAWGEEMEGDQFSFHGPATLVGDKLHTDAPDDLAKEGPRSYGKEARWSAFETKYFISAVVPLGGSVEKIQVSNNQNTVVNLLQTPYQTLQAGDSLSADFLIYFGPRDVDILQAVNHDLAQAIDFGFFHILAMPLLHVLKFFYGFLGNYGLAIIILTVIIKLLFWPLTQKSYASMKAMQKLQPEMAKMREKFKNDKQRLNVELMELYKKNRVNPLGGCLPMVIQIPVFFALYKVLLDAIDLRHAPFALWLTDLSAKDPYYITPLIMGATMFVQQKMTPSTMDPTQAKIFLLMPVIFTFLFLNFPSGLVIYWLINNLLTILQQYLIRRQA